MGELVYEDEHLRVFHSLGASKFIIGSFSHLGYPPDAASYWGQSRFEKLGIEALGFVAKANNFFPAASMEAAAAAVARYASKPFILYGHSMGAYAALKYSRLLRAAGVMASCPMMTIDPNDVPDDRRYQQFFDPLLNAGMDIKAADIGGRVTVMYDRFEHMDRYHIDRLRAVAPEAEIHEVHADFFGHEAVQVMIDQFVFACVVGQVFHGLPLLGLSKYIRRSKKESPKYLANLAQHVLDRSPEKYKTIQRIVGRIDRMASDRVDWMVAVQKAQIQSRIEDARGNVGAAIDYQARAIAIERAITGETNRFRVAALDNLRSRQAVALDAFSTHLVGA